ncbi:hypothetical protein CSUI_009309, partial [Cystoisospora suis]
RRREREQEDRRFGILFCRLLVFLMTTPLGVHDAGPAVLLPFSPFRRINGFVVRSRTPGG